jgi:hypothetical protein
MYRYRLSSRSLIDFGKAIRTLPVLAAICQFVFALSLGQVHADSVPEFPAATEISVATHQPEIVHFSLLGADWAKIPEGYSGVAPETVIAELNLPKEYVVRRNWFRNLFGLGPLDRRTTNVPIAFFYPSMRGAAYDRSLETRIGAIIDGGREDHFRKGVHSIIFRDGVMRDPSLDVNGLCGYVDRTHVGYAGDELYTACKEADQTFSIICFPLLNGRRACTSDSFLGGGIGGRLFYRYPMLREHLTLLGGFKKLVMSFIQTPMNR